MKKFSLLFVAFLFISCTNPSGATAFLESQGYTDIQTGGYDWLLSNKGDYTVTTFTAKNANGKVVKGAVSENFGFLGLGARMSIKIESEK